MIPKIIHYCWLSGDPFPKDIAKCIKSWKKYLPDYELVLWDLNRFPLEKSIWVQEAFEARKYAFAADYIRMYALYTMGGIYLDSDVEVKKSFDVLLRLPYFLGQENTPSGIEAATLGFEPGHPFIKMMLDSYEGRHFILEDGTPDISTPLPYKMRQVIDENFRYNSIDNIAQFDQDTEVINVFPIDWFSPKHWYTREIAVTKNTYSIHHFASSWMPADRKPIEKTKWQKFWDSVRVKLALGQKVKKVCFSFQHESNQRD